MTDEELAEIVRQSDQLTHRLFICFRDFSRENGEIPPEVAIDAAVTFAAKVIALIKDKASCRIRAQAAANALPEMVKHIRLAYDEIGVKRW